MLFKPGFVEFFQHEFDALAAEVSKLAHEVEFEIVDHVENGVAGRALRRVEAVFHSDPEPTDVGAAEPAVPGDNPEAPIQ
jgi:hypothetical protein